MNGAKRYWLRDEDDNDVVFVLPNPERNVVPFGHAQALMA
jgi:hypothetical protein